jgi:hypothetical protein
MSHKKRRKKEKEEEISIWWVIIACSLPISIFLWANLGYYGFIDPYANQRLELNITIRSVELWEDPRWSKPKLLLWTHERGVFFLEGNVTLEQLIVGNTYRMIYKNIVGLGSDIPFYYALTIERID